MARVYSYTRTVEDRALTVRIFNGSAGFSTAPTAIWLLDARGQLAQQPILFVLPAGTAAPQTNATGGTTGCVSLPIQPEIVCESRTAGYAELQISVPESMTSVHRVVVGLVGDSRVLKVDGPPARAGWRGGLSRGRLQIVRAAQVADLYVSSNSQTVEHFTRAAVMGGTAGSVAVAAAPCRTVAGLSTGHGAAVLAGGYKPAGISCGLSGSVLTGGSSSRRTTWSFTGDIWATNYTAPQATPGVLNHLTYAAQDVRLMVADGPF